MLLKLGQLVEVAQDLKEKKLKVVLCHGVFDLLHIGHIRHFKIAKAQGDVLIVTVTPDRFVNKGPYRPVFGEMLRAEAINALEYVDYVAINEWPTAVEAIKRLKPNVYAKGSDYADRDRDLTGEIRKEEEAIKEVGGRIHFTDEITFSSTAIINRYFNPYPAETQEFLTDFRQRYTGDDIINFLKKISDLKVLVFGEAIIDEYCYCQGLGKPPKDNIIAAKYLQEEAFAGGALVVANHIAAFCKHVNLVTCLGKTNNYERFVLSHLRPNVNLKAFYNESGPTIVKRRFIDPTFMTKFFEIAYLDEKLPGLFHSQVAEYLSHILENYNLIVIADFGHGFITEQTLSTIMEKMPAWVSLAVTCQVNSANQGFNLITKYRIADYICIDEPEVRLACSDKFGKLEELVEDLSHRINCSRIAVTRGHLGSMTYSDGDSWHIPVFSHHVVDRLGAGDAYLAVTAPCVAADIPMEAVGFIGNAAGALKAQTVGNVPLEAVALFKFIQTLLK